MLFSNSPLRSFFFYPLQSFARRTTSTLSFFAPSAVCYDAVIYSQQQQQQQHISRSSYVYVAPSPVTYVVHLAQNMQHTSPEQKCLPSPIYLGNWDLATICRVVVLSPRRIWEVVAPSKTHRGRLIVPLASFPRAAQGP